jgi:hypothetical protein
MEIKQLFRFPGLSPGALSSTVQKVLAILPKDVTLKCIKSESCFYIQTKAGVVHETHFNCSCSNCSFMIGTSWKDLEPLEWVIKVPFQENDVAHTSCFSPEIQQNQFCFEIGPRCVVIDECSILANLPLMYSCLPG